VSVPLSGGAAKILKSGASGKPAAPVWLGGCSFGAWSSAAPRCAQVCDGRSPRFGGLAEVSSADVVKFRVNRDRVELNDLNNGHNFVFTAGGPPMRVDDWDQAEKVRSGPGGDDTTDTNANGQSAQLDLPRVPHPGTNKPPIVRPDTQGTRAGRPVVVQVLANDSDPENDPLTVTDVKSLDGAPAAQIVDSGRAVQAPAPPSSTPLKFQYTASDGQSTATGVLTVTLHPETENGPPSLSNQTVTIGAGKSITIDVLATASDPDGDPLTVTGVNPAAGTAQFRATGQVQITAPTGSAEPYQVRYTVNDDHGKSAVGIVSVKVQPAEDLRPIRTTIRSRWSAAIRLP
jgi:hypothetical protein